MEGLGEAFGAMYKALVALFVLVLVVGVALIFSLFGGCRNGKTQYERGYRQGQIDAVQGHVRVRQVTKTEWEEVRKP